jgi:hypothetical protein
MTQMPLQNCFLCADCDTVSDSSTQCPCGSQHGLQSLAKALNRPAKMGDIHAEVQRMLDLLDEACQ